MSSTASVLAGIDDISSQALEGYAISEGDPVQITSSPSGVISTVGSPVAGSSGTLLIIIVLVVIAVVFGERRER